MRRPSGTTTPSATPRRWSTVTSPRSGRWRSCWSTAVRTAATGPPGPVFLSGHDGVFWRRLASDVAQTPRGCVAWQKSWPTGGSPSCELASKRPRPANPPPRALGPARGPVPWMSRRAARCSSSFAPLPPPAGWTPTAPPRGSSRTSTSSTRGPVPPRRPLGPRCHGTYRPCTGFSPVSGTRPQVLQRQSSRVGLFCRKPFVNDFRESGPRRHRLESFSALPSPPPGSCSWWRRT